MSFRRLLLIDSDPAFHRLLYENLAPYGFEIYVVENSQDPLSEVREIHPEIIFIAVEAPDKVGYSLCNRAKKGIARDIPVVLTTSTVPPSGFNSHRKLKVHADEYIDKRVMTTEEVVQKVDRLVGLGAPVVAPNASQAPSEDTGVSIGGLDGAALAGGENDFEDAESTHIATPGFLGQLEAETDAAFAALGAENSAALSLEDDPALDPAEGRSSTEAEDAGKQRTTDVHAAAEPPALDDAPATDVREATGGAPSPFPDEFVDPDDSWAEDARTVALPNGADAAAAVREAANGAAADEAPRGDTSDAADGDIEQLELDDLEIEPDMLEDVEAEGQRSDPNTDVNAAEAPQDDASERGGAAAEAESSKRAESALDLGLDDVAELASSEKTGDVASPAQAARVTELERENERLRAEVERLQKTGEGQSPYSREREFLNLREVINKKEREVLNLQDELGAREREILEAKEKLRKLERERSDTEGKLLETEQKLLEANETISTIEDEKIGARERARRLEGELSEAKSQIDALVEEHARALETQKRELEEAHKAALGEAEARRERELAAAEESRKSALERAEEESQRAIEALKSEHQEALQARDQEHRSEMEALEDRHAGQVARLERESKEALEQAEAQRRQELEEAARARSEAEEALKAQLEAERSKAEQLDVELQQARQTIEERDATVSVLRGQIGELEEQGRTLQEQVLTAHQRIQEHQETAARARKAMSVALTILEDAPEASAPPAEARQPVEEEG